MCGIVGAVAERGVSGILLEGLKRLEYRGYDSAGLALLAEEGRHGDRFAVVKTVGKVGELARAVARKGVEGNLGIAHTRWATHGRITVANAHPHQSDRCVAIVHNGIIENYESLRSSLLEAGYEFKSQTDSEVIAHLIHQARAGNSLSLVAAVRAVAKTLRGAYGLCVADSRSPGEIVVARSGSPLVIGVGIGENFVASDPLALGQVTDRFIYLEEGDVARVGRGDIAIWNGARKVKRALTTVANAEQALDKGGYGHYMRKEIFEQPQVIRATLNGRVSATKVLEEAFGINAAGVFDRVRAVQIVACGTSYHAGFIARYWIESIARLPCSFDIASEFRYRDVMVADGTLLVTISQSGETADTLAALRHAKQARLGYVATMAICNVATSSLVRESDFSLLTIAGREIGVASTKSFTAQLTLLIVLAITLARRTGLSAAAEARMVRELNSLPLLLEKTLTLDKAIKRVSRRFADKHHSLFLGRGIHYPVAKEGALKLKEISYIHAEAYPAGELKHGPLALVDSDMPVVAVAPNDDLLGKLRANLAEVAAREGKLYVFADETTGFEGDRNCKVIHVPASPRLLDPIVFTVPLQLLAYHVAIAKGTDVDQPRNLAKSVTVE